MVEKLFMDDKYAQHEHEWRVEDIITNDVIICCCENCEKKAQFIKQNGSI